MSVFCFGFLFVWGFFFLWRFLLPALSFGVSRFGGVLGEFRELRLAFWELPFWAGEVEWGGVFLVVYASVVVGVGAARRGRGRGGAIGEWSGWGGAGVVVAGGG